jgi:Ca-activated chloride channel family protein
MKKFSTKVIALLLVLVVVLSAACSASSKVTTTTGGNQSSGSQTQPASTYAPTTRPATSRTSQVPQTTSAMPTLTVPATTTSNYSGTNPPTSPSTIGLSTGGAKDIVNFRENIHNNYLPLPTDITYEGLFYDYYFDTGSSGPARKLFSPSYSSAVTRDPFSDQTEYYLAVGLNSGLQESDFQRKKLNLVIVMDNSGSMDEKYTQYFYDRNGQQVDAYAEEGVIRKNKMDSAAESVVNILDQLNGGDWFSIVTFNSQAQVLKPIGPVNQINMNKIKDQVLDLMAGGSTNLDSGLNLALQQFGRLSNLNADEYENRVIILTDAQPNSGDYTSGGLLRTLENNSGRRIYTTFIGIGVDFNSKLIEQISRIKACNYYSVHSPREFRTRIQDEFDYMVTPLVFNVELKFESPGWRIEKVFGSPQADEASGRLMRIDTLFASKADESGQVKGGLVLVKLKKTTAGNASIYLRTSYQDRNGRADGDVQIINLESTNPEYFDNSGIRKGVLLTRYAALMKNWISEERQYASRSDPWTPCVGQDNGIILPVENPGQWERQSINLSVSPGYERLFQKFAGYFTAEMNIIGDYNLGQELDILHQLERQSG